MGRGVRKVKTHFFCLDCNCQTDEGLRLQHLEPMIMCVIQRFEPTSLCVDQLR